MCQFCSNTMLFLYTTAGLAPLCSILRFYLSGGFDGIVLRSICHEDEERRLQLSSFFLYVLVLSHCAFTLSYPSCAISSTISVSSNLSSMKLLMSQRPLMEGITLNLPRFQASCLILSICTSSTIIYRPKSNSNGANQFS